MTQSKPQRPSWRHHYIPQFYLKRWDRGDGRVVEFTRTPDGVRSMPKPTKATGFGDELYSVGIRGFEDVLEQRFFKIVDDRADKVFANLLEQSGRSLSERDFSSMSRFIMSMLLRDPDSVASTRAKILRDYPIVLRGFQDRYAATRAPGDPEDVVEYFAAADPDLSSRFFLKIMRSTIDNPKIGARLNRMTWGVCDVSGSPIRLLTSDRPVVMSDNGIAGRESVVALPASPTKVLVGVNDPELLRSLDRWPSEDVVLELNVEVVRQASAYVYGADDSQRAFVEEHFGRRAGPTVQDRIRALPTPFTANGSHADRPSPPRR